MDFDNVFDGPFVVLSDSFNFDYADDSEIAYISKSGYEALKQQNGSNITQGYFDVVDVKDLYTVRLSEVLKFYFDNNSHFNPMK